ncbi:MAG: dihydroorotase [Phycisphaerales bacterium]|nr:dihydroorotase [Phycisphaerales bacterium]
MPKLLIVGGRVLDPSTGLDKAGDVAVEDGVIRAIGPKLERPSGVRVVDAEGCLVTPGLIDPHVHLREPGNERAETLATGTRAAVEGGFTSVACMPNTTPCLDNDTMVRYIDARGRETGHCRVFSVAAVTKGRRGEELAEIELMAAAGAVGFSDDGDCVASAGMQQRAFVAIKPTGRAMMQHCQEATLTNGGVMNAGEVATRLGLGGWPRAAEEIIIERDVSLNRGIGCRYHVQHLSSGGSVEIVRRARKEGLPVTAEASPHHLLLTCDLIETLNGGYDTRLKMNPPLRDRHDIEAIRLGVADGTISVLGTDHAPHTQESKDVPFDSASFGIIGLETALALYVKALVSEAVIGWPRLIELMTIEPARLCGLDALGIGSLRVGGPADITVIDPDAEWTISREGFAGQSANSPFVGWTVKGRAIATVVKGRVQMERRSAVVA